MNPSTNSTSLETSSPRLWLRVTSRLLLLAALLCAVGASAQSTNWLSGTNLLTTAYGTLADNDVVNNATLIITNGGALTANQLNVGPTNRATLTLDTNGGILTVNTLLATNVIRFGVTNSFVNLNGGALTTSNAATAIAAHILVASNATFNLNSSWNLNGGSNFIASVGSGTPAGSLVVGNATSNVVVTVNSNATFLNSSPASLTTNVNNLFIGNGNATGNLLIITNGGQATIRNGSGSVNLIVGNSVGANSNGLIVAGADGAGKKATLNAGGDRIYVGNGVTGGINNYLRVDAGGVITNAQLFSWAINSGIVITNGGYASGSGATFGRQGLNNLWTIAGTDAAGSRSTLLLTASGMNIGGAQIATGATPGTNNVLWVGQNGLFTNTTGGKINVGADTNALGNSLVIADGGQVYANAASQIGSTVSANSNSITIGGSFGTTNSLLSLGNASLTIGNHAQATNNSLTLNSGGVLTNVSSIAIGGVNSVLAINSGATLALTAVTNGNVIANNASVNPTYQIQSGGAVIIDTVGYTVTSQLPLQEDPGNPGGSLTKRGTGTLTLNGASTYSGGTVLAAGTLGLGHAAALGASGTIDLTGNGGLRWGAGINVDLSGRLQLQDGITATFDTGTNSVTFASALLLGGSGTAGLAKLGTGTLTLGTPNTYTGPTAVSAGTLLVSGDASAATGAVTVSSLATLGGAGNLGGNVTLAALANLVPGGYNSIGTLNVPGLALTSDTLYFDLSSDGSLSSDTVNIANNLTLSGVNVIVLNFPTGPAPEGTYTLMTYAATNGPGSLVLFGSYPNAVLNVGLTSVTITVAPATTTFELKWSGTEDSVWTTVNNWLNGAGPASYADGDAVMFDDTASGNFIVTGGAVAPGSVTFNNSATTYTNSAAIGGTGPVVKLGSGAVTLSGNNSFSGGLTLNAGALRLGSTNALGTGLFTINGGTLDATLALTNVDNNAQVWNNDFTFTGTANLNLGAGAVTLGANSAVTVSANTLAVGGAIGDGAANGFTKLGAGTLSLSANSTYTGPTLIGAGTVVITNAPQALGATAGGTTVSNGATLKLYGGLTISGEPLTLGAYNGGVVNLQSATGSNVWTGPVTVNGTNYFARVETAVAGAALTLSGPVNVDASGVISSNLGLQLVAQGDGPILISGNITNSGGFIRASGGVGVVTLAGTNSYTGKTDIGGGTLLINGDNSAAIGPVTVNQTSSTQIGTLGGSGVIGGKVLMNTDTILAPGGTNNVGTLTLTNTLTLTTNKLFFDLTPTTNDQLVVGAALTNIGVNTIYLTGSAPAGTNTLITFGSLTGPGSFVLGATYGNVYLITNGLSLQLVVTGTGFTSLTWKGYLSGTWDVTSTNWLGNGVTNFNPGNDVLFDDTLAANNALTNTDSVLPGSVTVNNSLTNYTIATAIGGSAGVTKLGSARLTLSGTNSYSGVTMVNQGTLAITTNTALGSALGGTVIFDTGSTVNGGQLSLNNVLTLAEPVSITGPGDGFLNNYTACLDAASGTNSLTGTITIVSNTPTRISVSGANTVLNLSGLIQRSSGGTNSINFNMTGTGGTLNVNSAIQNPGGVIYAHSGGGSVVFNAAGNNIGDVMVQYGGNLKVTVTDALATNRNLWIGGTSTTDGVGTGTFYLLGVSQTVNSLNGQVGTNANTFLRRITSTNANAMTLTVGSLGGGGTFDGVIENGTGGGAIAFTKVGSGTEIFAGNRANTYTGNTIINGGVLQLAKFDGTNSIAGNVLILAGTLQNLTNNQIADTATVVLSNSVAKWDLNGRSETVANVDMQNANTGGGLNLGLSGVLTISGTLNHVLGDITLTSGGTGASINANTVTNLGGTWTFGTAVAGPGQQLIIGSGGLVLGGGTTIAINSAPNNANSITLSGNLTTLAGSPVNTISDASTPYGYFKLDGSRTFNINSDLTISARITNGAGVGALTKTGLGALTLSATNFYTGATVVSNGTLILPASATISNSPSISIAGGTLTLVANSNGIVNDRIGNAVPVTLGGSAIPAMLVLVNSANVGTNSETVGTLTLAGSVPATIDFGTGTNRLFFADSSAMTWTTNVMIANWSGSLGGAGVDQLFIGSGATLTAGQLANITFVNPTNALGNFTAVQLGTGEVVPGTQITAGAGNDTWNQFNSAVGGGTNSWNQASNWLSGTGFPNALDAVAKVNINITNGNQVINLNQPVTVGALYFGDSATNADNVYRTYTINSNATGATLTFDVSSGKALLFRAPTTVLNLGQNDTINANVILNKNLDAIMQYSGSGNGIFLNGAISGAGGIQLRTTNMTVVSGNADQILRLANTNNSFTGDIALANGRLEYFGDVLPSVNGALGNSANPVRINTADSHWDIGGGLSSAISAQLRLVALNDTNNYTFGRDLDFSYNYGGAGAGYGNQMGRETFAFGGDGVGGVNTNTLTFTGTVTLPGNGRGLHLYAERQGMTMRFTGPVNSAGNNGALFMGYGGPNATNVDGFSHGSYRFSNLPRSFGNSISVTRGQLIVEGSVPATGNSPIGTSGLSLADGSGGNVFTSPEAGPNRSIYLDTPGSYFNRNLTPSGGSSFGTPASAQAARYGTNSTFANSSFNVLNGHLFGGLNTSGTVTFSNTITPGGVRTPQSGTSGGIGGSNEFFIVHNLALVAAAGGTVEFAGQITGSTDFEAKQPYTSGTNGASTNANLTRITINQFRNHPNLDTDVNGLPDANANALVGTPQGGTVILSATNTYSGTTEVLGGTLLVNTPNGSGTGTNTVIVTNGAALGGSGRIAGNVALAAGTVLVPGTYTSAGTLTLSNGLTMNNSGLFGAVTTATNSKVALTGALTLTGANTVVLNFLAGPIAEGSYTLVTMAATNGAGTLALAGGYTNATLVVSATSVVLQVGAGGTSGGNLLAWKGNVSGTWDISTTTNWLNTGVGAVYTEGGAVMFDDAAVNFNVSGGTVTPAYVMFNNNSYNYTLSASLAGATNALIKNGGGALTLGGNNTFNGGLALNAGALSLNSATALGAGRLTVNAGTLDNTSGAALTNLNNNPQTWNGSFTFNGTTNLHLGTGAVTLGASLGVAVNANTLTVGGPVAGAFALTKQGGGKLTLSGSNTFSGGLTLNAGTLNVAGTNALGTGTLTFLGGALDNTSGASFTNLNNNTQVWNGSFTFAGTTNLHLGTGAVSLVAVGTVTVSANTLTVGGPISGAGALIKSGGGTLVLNGNNSYTGNTTNTAGTLDLTGPSGTTGSLWVSGGTVIVRNTNALGFGSANFSGGGTLQFRLDGGGNIPVTNLLSSSSSGSITIDVNNNGTGTGGLVQLPRYNVGAGTTTAITGGNGYNLSLDTVLQNSGGGGAGGSTHTFNPTTASLSIRTLDSLHTNLTDTFVLGGTSSGNAVTGVISNAAAGTLIAITKTGSGLWTISGTNAYSGPTLVSAGTLVLNGNNSAATNTVTVNSATLAGSGTIGGSVTLSNATLLPGGFASVGTLTLTNALTLNGTNKLFFKLNNNTGTNDLVVVGSGLTVNGTNSIYLTGSSPAGTNTLMTFASTNGAGTFVLGMTNPNVFLIYTATSLSLAVTNTGYTNSILTWKGYVNGQWDDAVNVNWLAGYFAAGSDVLFDDTLVANSAVSSTNTVLPNSVTINNSTTTYTINAAIGGSGGLTKSGIGTVNLNGTNAYDGVTVINAGIVVVTNASGLGSTVGGTVINFGGSVTNGGQLYVSGGITLNENITMTGGRNGAYYSLGFRANGGSNTLSNPLILAGNASSEFRIGTAGAGAVLTFANGITRSGTAGTNTGTLLISSGGPGTNYMNGPIVNHGGTVEFVDSFGVTFLNAVNTDVGNAQVDYSGVVKLGVNNAFPTNSQWRIGMNTGGSSTDTNSAIGRLDMNGYNLFVAGLEGANANVTNTTSQRRVTNSATSGTATLTIGAAANSKTFDGVIENGTAGGTVAIIKTNANNQTFAGTVANTYTGLTTISGGSLILGKVDGVNAIAGNILIDAGTLLNLTNNQIADTATVTLNGTNASWLLNSRTEIVANVDVQNTGPGPNFGLMTGSNGVLMVSGTLNHVLGDITFSSGVPGSSITAATVTNLGGTWIFGTGNGGSQRLVITNGLGLIIGGGSGITNASSANSTNYIYLSGNLTSLAAANPNVIADNGGYATFQLDGSRTFDVADGAAASDLTMAINITNGVNAGAITKTGAGTLTLSAASTYSGGTVVSNGVLLVNNLSGSGTGAGAVTVASGATLGGSGIIGGTVTLPSGAFATNTVGSPLTIAGAVVLNVNTINVGSASALGIGDYLLITNTSGGIAGSFAGVVTVGGAGLAPGTSAGILTTGNAVMLQVVSAAPPYPATGTNINFTPISGGNTFDLTWPAEYIGWQLQSNAVDVSLTNYWFLVPGSTTTNKVTITINPSLTNVFYRMQHP